MDIIGNLALRLFAELKPLLDWAVGNWAVTLPVLGLLLLGAGKYRRPDQRHS